MKNRHVSIKRTPPPRGILFRLLLTAFLLPGLTPPAPAGGHSLHCGASQSDSLQWVSLRTGNTTISYTESDRELLPAIQSTVVQAEDEITKFFRHSFPFPVTVRIFPARASLTAYWRAAWHDPGFQPQCWMVASGTGSALAVLSPRTWSEEACEHDPNDSASTYRLIAHELVHVFQGQRNPHPELDSLDDIAWFVEGVATYASGQLEQTHAGRVREAVENGRLPDALEDVWSGPYRYGLSASLVQFIDTAYGRATVTFMLAGTSEKELLGRLGITEEDLLSRWKASLRSTSPTLPR